MHWILVQVSGGCFNDIHAQQRETAMSDLSSGNIYQALPDTPQTNEVFQVLAGGAGSAVKIERIVSQGHVTPKDEWYDQDQSEWVIVLQGQAVLSFQDRDDMHLNAGDYVCIPAHVRHRVSWTLPDADTVWLAVFFP